MSPISAAPAGFGRTAGRSRQDAPAGKSALLMHSPGAHGTRHSLLDTSSLALSTGRSEPFATFASRAGALTSRPASRLSVEAHDRLPPTPPLTARWEPVRPAAAAAAAAGSAWRSEVQQAFPRVTGHHVRIDKDRLLASRSAERWADRLAQRRTAALAGVAAPPRKGFK